MDVKTSSKSESESEVDSKIKINVDVSVGNVSCSACSACGNGENGENGELIALCHRPEGGDPVTLNLPQSAVDAHLRQHTNDTLGACEITTVIEKEVKTGDNSETKVATKSTPAKKKAANKKASAKPKVKK